MSITVEFNLGEHVLLKEIQRPAMIEVIQFDRLGITYRVAYWDNSKRETAWVYGHEIERKSA